ncbi:MAG TPA: PAS domain S-box protein, partial [Planctomycetaceae bacterium]
MAGPQELFDLFIRRVEDYAVYMLDPGGHVVTWNLGAERIKGYTTAEILGKHLSTFYPPEDRHKAAEALRTAAETGHFEGEAWRIRKDGTRFWGLVSLTALRDDAGELKGFAKITRDLTERKRAEEGLRATQLKYELLMAGVKEYAVFFMDTEGRVIDWSPAAERLLGYSQAEILGRHLRTFFPPEQHGPGGTPEVVLKAAAAKGSTEEESWHVRKGGDLFWGSGITSALRDETGRLKGFAKVLLDRTEKKRTEEALRDADRRKDEFLAMLAHELRNPLAPIRSGLDLLRMEGVDSETVEIMSEQVGHVVRLVDDLLDVSRILRNKVDLKRTPVELAEVVRRAAETVRPMTEAEGQAFSVSLPDEPVWLDADPVRLAQVLSNLLTNASKYTEPGGRITLTAERRGGEAVIRVADTGIGIDPDLLPHIFELFTQSERSIDRSQGGLGIGLTVVKSLVEMHGGTVTARSDGPGRGSEFAVRLPTIESPTPAAAGGAPHDPASDALRILVVDDNVPAATLLSRILSKLGGYDVRSAYDGAAALEAAERLRPDLIFLDIGLPKLDGYEVARRLR